MYILNIETATKNCSVALAKDGQTIKCMEIAEQGYSHAEKLHVFIGEIMEASHIKLTDLSAIAVSQGPGSYTGLRIGVSAAKGLCYALDIPLVAVDTLQILTAQVKEQDGLVIPMIDARRMEVFSAVFDANQQKIREIKAEIIEENSFSEITTKAYLIGDGAAKCKTVLNGDHFVYNDAIVYPSANEMSALSYAKYKISDTVDVAYFEPYYLKDFMMTKKLTS